MTKQRLVRSGLGVVFSFGLAAVIWEAFSRSGLFAPALTPSLIVIGSTLGQMLLSGTMLIHILYTLYRILVGLVLAGVVGVPVGLLMGRVRRVERFLLPLVSVLNPIPSLAWVPVFILWFGLGNAAAIALVFYAATFPLILNTWTGVRSVNRLWIRAAEAMGADGKRLFRKVVLPGSMPFVITGLRQAFARSWIAVVGGEMIAATSWGLGWVIFDSREFLNTDVMLGSLAVIGILGLVFERLIFQLIEGRTVGRWGMVRAVKG
jgi:NitT/TauT family transport system permease protein